MNEADFFDLGLQFSSHNPNAPTYALNQLRENYGMPPRLPILVANGPRKNQLAFNMGMCTLHTDATHLVPQNSIDQIIFGLSQGVDSGRLKKLADDGEQMYNQLTGINTYGPYYPHQASILPYTAGAAISKLTHILASEADNPGMKLLLQHEVRTTDWTIAHGERPESMTIENKPRDEIEGLLQRLYTAQKNGEPFFSTMGMAVFYPETGTIGALEVLVRCGILKPDMPFNEIAKHVSNNAHSLPAGMDLRDAIKLGFLVNDNHGGKYPAHRRWFYKSGAKPDRWTKYILPNDLEQAEHDGIWIPTGDALLTNEDYRTFQLDGLSDVEAKKHFFGLYD